MSRGRLLGRRLDGDAAPTAVIDLTAVGEALEPMFCHGCGRLAPSAARYCPYCATALLEEGVAEEPEVPASAETVIESPVGEAPRRPRRRRRVAVASVAVLVVLVGAGAGGALALRDDAPRYDVEAGLAKVAAAIAKPWDATERAATLDKLEAAAAAAAEALPTVRSELQAIEEVDDRDERAALRAAYQAEAEMLTVLSGLGEVSATDSEDWADIVTDVRTGLEGVEQAAAELSALVETVAVSSLVDPMAQAVAPLELLLTGAKEKMLAWDKARDEVAAERFSAQAALDGYVEAFNDAAGRYSALRDELASYIDEMYDKSFADAYAYFGGAVAKRQEVRAAISTLTPPPGLVAAHTAALGIVDSSVAAVNDARRGLEEYQWEYYFSWESTPGWEDFSSKSDEISEGWTVAVAGWHEQVAAEQDRINALADPPKPSV